MEIKGKVVSVGQIVSGTSQSTGNQWKSQEFVVEEVALGVMRPQRVALRLLNDKIDQMNLKFGDMVDVFFRLGVREWNGKYYNDLMLDSILKIGAESHEDGTKVETHTLAPEKAAGAKEMANNLPF